MPKMRFDDDWGGGGGGASSAPAEGLDERLNRILASRIAQYRYKWRLLALIFGQPDHDLIKNQISPKLKYWNSRSGERLDFICVGFRKGIAEFSNDLFADSIRWLENRSAWRYSGQTDLVLLNARVERKTKPLELETGHLVSLALETAIEQGAIQDAPSFLEEVFYFADHYAGDDPAWGFSDEKGKELGISGLKSLLINSLPKSLRKEAKAAFHFYVKEHTKSAA